MQIGICSWNRENVARFLDDHFNDKDVVLKHRAVSLSHVRIITLKDGEPHEYIWVRPDDLRGRRFDKIYVDVSCSVKCLEKDIKPYFKKMDYFGWEY